MTEAFAPTEEQRRLVRAFAGFGIPQEDMANHLGIDTKTLRKHFRDELDRGVVEANAKVAQSLFQMATTGKNVAAAIFWMKARANWSEKQRVEHAGTNGAPLTLAVITGVPRDPDQPPALTAEAWEAQYSPHRQHRRQEGETTAAAPPTLA